MQKGFKEVTLNEIVKETKLSKGAFYHYFSSKEQLYLEIIDTCFFKWHTNYNQFNQYSLYNFFHEYIDFISKILNEIRVFIDDVNHTAYNMYFALMSDALKHFPHFQEKTKKMHIEELEAWIKIVKTARSNNEIKSKLSDEQIAKTFIYTKISIWMHNILLDRVAPLEITMRELLDLWDNFYKELSK